MGQHDVGLGHGPAPLVHGHVLQGPVQDSGTALPQHGLLL